ncbi:MAG: glycosyltransferase family 39 protein [Patescibacteria group bacterium]
MSLYFAIITGILLRFWRLGLRPFDGDEGVILWQATQPSFGQFWESIARDAHPPLIHVLSWFGLKIFGESEFALRFFPAVFGILLIPASFLLARELIGRRQALFVAWLVALSPFLVSFSQEARMYAPLGFFVVMALWALSKNKPLHLAMFTLLAIYTHYLGLLLLPVLIIRRQWKPLLAVIILTLPLLPLALPQFIGRIQEAGGSNPIANIKGIVNAFYRFAAGRSFLGLELNPANHLMWLRANPLSWFAFALTLVVPAILFIYGLPQNFKKNEWRPVWVLGSLAVVLALVASEVGGKAARNLSFLAPFYLMVIGASLFNLKQIPKLLGGVALLGILGLGLTQRYFKESLKPGVPAIVDYIASQNVADAAVLARGSFLKGESTIFNYYWRKRSGGEPPVVVDYYGEYRIGNLRELRKQSVKQRTEELLKDHPTVFFYDFSYLPHDLEGQPTILGYDKEDQPIALWRVDR